MPDSEGYIVVFEYTDAAGGYAGVRTRTPYASKEEFDTRREAHTQKEKVIAEGVSDAESLRLVQQTPVRSRLLAALEESTINDAGDISIPLLRSHITQALFIIEIDQAALAQS